MPRFKKMAIPGWQRPPLIGRLEIRWKITFGWRERQHVWPMRIAPVYIMLPTMEREGWSVRCPVCETKLRGPILAEEIPDMIQCPRCALFLRF